MKFTSALKSQLLWGSIPLNDPANLSKIIVNDILLANDVFECVTYILGHPALFDDPVIFLANSIY